MKSIFFCKEQTSVVNALKKINDNGSRCLIVLDNSKKFLGVLSDGDLRKKISRGYKLSEKVKNIYNKKPLYFFEKKFSLQKIENIFYEKKLDLIPILKKNKTIKKIFFLNDFIEEDKLPKKNLLSALIMAGGKGTRLDPFTRVLPKPLIPIKGKPIIEIIIEKFFVSSVKDIYVSLNYKSKVIKSYLNANKHLNKIRYIDEDKPLGTAGCLKFFQNFGKKDLIITNCDILLNFNIENVYKSHLKNKNDLTIVISPNKIKSPYGSVKIDHESMKVKSMEEKPEFEMLTNIGFYIMSHKTLKNLKIKSKIDMNELINDLLKKNRRVGYYKISEKSWIDIGRWEEYKKTFPI
jgi:dTDP-glucose pyrophosphorylase